MAFNQTSKDRGDEVRRIPCLSIMSRHLFLLQLMAAFLSAASLRLHPVVLVPGSGGNQLEARLTDAYKPSSLVCNLWHGAEATSSKKWFRLWFDPTVLLAPFTQCFAERMTLHYDRELDDFYNTPGVETRVPDFGTTNALQYLDPNLKFISKYMAGLVDALEGMGYKDGENIFGAPYDFRYGLTAPGHPCQVGSQYLDDLKKLIETASEANGGEPVILLSHSLGGLFALSLLNRNPMEWRQRYVKHFLALSAPWGGTVQEMLTFASGYTLGVPLVDPLLVREEQRSSESNIWLLPAPRVFGQRPLVVVASTNVVNKSYTAGDMVSFLEDIGFPEGVYPYKTRTLPLVEEGWAPPGVPMTLIVGSGVGTPETLYYRLQNDGSAMFNEQPEVVYGDGDGTVNMASLISLQVDWSVAAAEQRLKVTKIPGVSHTAVLTEDAALMEITREISEINSDQNARLISAL